jgi:anti-anti-sigma regulatory factor
MDDPVAEIRVERPAEDAVVAIFVGDHDLADRDETGNLLQSLIDENALVVADLSEATFIDSAMIHLLLLADGAARVRGKTFRLQLGTADIVRRALELSGVLKRIDSASSRDEALRRGSGRAA